MKNRVMNAAGEDYYTLYAIWSKVYTYRTAGARKKSCDAFWNANKKDSSVIQEEIRRLELRNQLSLTSRKKYWSQFRKPKQVDIEEPKPQVTSDITKNSTLPAEPFVQVKKEPTIRCMAQAEVESRIKMLSTQILEYEAVKEEGIASVEQLNEIERIKQKLTSEKKQLKKLQNACRNQQAFRERQRKFWAGFKERYPEVAKKYGLGRTRCKTNQQPLETSQPQPLQTIENIVAPKTSGDESLKN